MWSLYSRKKQTLAELGEKYERSLKWVRKQLDANKIIEINDIIPQKTIIVPDTTFWGRSYGVTVLRSWDLRRNIWWNEVPSEKQAHYLYGRKILEERGWVFLAAVIDGRRGLATVFKDIPVQVCHFHQMKTVTKYLTRKPKTEAGQELRQIMLTLPHTTEKVFTKAILLWGKNGTTSLQKKHTSRGLNIGTTRTRMCGVPSCRSNTILQTYSPI